MAGLANSSNSNALQQWRCLFEAQETGRSPVAQQHMQQLLRLGLPTRKHENWKHTPLDGLLNNTFIFTSPSSLSAPQRDELALSVDALRLVFVEGNVSAELSDDIAASGFAIRIDDNRRTLPAPVQEEVFLHLTVSLAETVTHIHVAKNTQPEKNCC